MKFIKNAKNNIPFLINLINKQNLNEYIKKLNFSFEANKYFNDRDFVHIVEQNIPILNPIIPTFTKKVLNAINTKDILIDNIQKIIF